MDKEAKERLVKALEFIQSAQAHLLNNVIPPEDQEEVRKHFAIAWELLLDAADVLEPLTRAPLTPSQSPGTAA